MKNKLIELDVDFIGGQEPITKEEELAISAFILACKEKRQLQAIRKSKKSFRKRFRRHGGNRLVRQRFMHGQKSDCLI